MVNKNEMPQPQRRNPNQGFRGNHEQGPRRENSYGRGYQRDGWNRHGSTSQNAASTNAGPAASAPAQVQQPRYTSRFKAEETIDDIKADITRIEKEIQLELKEIRSLKLGL